MSRFLKPSKIFPVILLALSILGGSVTPAAEKDLSQHIQGIAWERYQDEAVRLLQEYLRIDTSNPPGNEQAAAEFFHRLFDDARIPNTIYTWAPGRANFYAVLKGDGSLRPLILLNHSDVVRATPKNWKAPPFSGEILNDEIYGRGALDMKGEGLLQAMVMLIAARERLPLNRDLIFLATGDEEVNDEGSQWILDRHPELVRSAEYLLTEGGSSLIYEGRGTIYGVGVAEKAPFWIRMTATGRGGHGSVPIAESAPAILARAMQRVVDWQTPIRVLPQVEEYFRQVAPLEKEPRASKFRNIRKALKNPAFARLLSLEDEYNYLVRNTISLTVMKGSEQTNVIPDTAWCDLDIRLLPGEDPKAFFEQLRAIVGENRVQLVPIFRFRTPNSSPTDTPVYRVIEQVVRQYNPDALVTPVLNSGFTESQMYRPSGITCYGFSPIELTQELDSTQHAANERVPVEQVRRGLKMLYEVVARATNQ